MSLTSFSFLGIYFPLLLIVYYNPFFRSNNFKNIILLLASLGLYAFGEPIYIVLLIVSILINYIFVVVARKTNKAIFRYVIIAIDVLVLFFFKYNQNNIIFPLGLSYFTFKEISFIVDSTNQDKDSNLFECALYIANFITMSSGPLHFYNNELENIRNRKNDVQKGLEKIIVGLAKKIIIADSITPLVNVCFSMTDRSLLMAWIGLISFALRLYFDFSGYSDLAIGVGYLFGYELPENFNLPYTAVSISDFWKRWHISLTKWFTKYLYIPLGGSRVNKTRHILNLFIVWLCTGLWHGLNINFVIWAMIFFVFQTIEKYTNINEKIKKYHLEHFYVLFIVLISWIFFNTNSFQDAISYLASLFSFNNGFITNNDLKIVGNYLIPLIVGIILSTNMVTLIKEKLKDDSKYNSLYHFILLILFIVSLVLMLGRGYTAALYAGF